MMVIETSRSPTIHLEGKTLTALEAYRQHLASTGYGLLNYDKVIAILLQGKQTKQRSK
jgi:hypothetical protein